MCLNTFSLQRSCWVGIWLVAKPSIIETVFGTTIALKILSYGRPRSHPASWVLLFVGREGRRSHLFGSEAHVGFEGGSARQSCCLRPKGCDYSVAFLVLTPARRTV
jgi:hypothetical protein